MGCRARIRTRGCPAAAGALTAELRRTLEHGAPGGKRGSDGVGGAAVTESAGGVYYDNAGESAMDKRKKG